VFRALWIATFASNMGTLMQNVGAAWFMTTLAPSPLLVALVQTANTLPVFLLAMLAGALADIVDRRKLLLLTQGWMCAISFLLAALTLIGWANPWTLLGLTFALGLGAALNAPAWQAIVSELVPGADLPSAVALNSMGLNLARAIAPAFGGLLVAAAGPGAAFLLNSASFVGVLVVLFRWKRPASTPHLPAEPLSEALGAGIRYVRYAPNVRAVLIRTGAFMVFGTAIWALLPLISRFGLGLGPAGYGLLMGCLGFGAVMGALLLSRLRQAFPLNHLLAGATLLYAVATLVTAAVHHVAAVCVALAAAGLAWLVLLANFNATVQATAPAWVRGRALAAYLLVAFGGQALGSAFWGASVSWLGLWTTLGICGVGLMLNLGLVRRYGLSKPGPMHLETQAELPLEAEAWRDEPAPIRVSIAYQIDPAEEPAFRSVMQELRLMRLRNGARRWELRVDSGVGACVERFELSSGTALMRSYARMTRMDDEAVRRAGAFHREPRPPVVTIGRCEPARLPAVNPGI
jgi:MFS family permease